MSQAKPYRVISFDLCPYVQRSIITLEEAGVPYTLEYIDLAHKPDWFVQMSPFGKVPVLEVETEGGSTVLFESAVINEYINDTICATDPSKDFHPADPLARAHNRAWIEFASALGGVTYTLMSREEDAVREAAPKINEMLGRLEEQVKLPFFNGERFSLVDAATAPMLRYLRWASEIEPSLDVYRGLDKVPQWQTNLLERPSVIASVKPGLRAIFIEYLKGRGSQYRNVNSSWLGELAA